jgi:hypothetical protein
MVPRVKNRWPAAWWPKRARRSATRCRHAVAPGPAARQPELSPDRARADAVTEPASSPWRRRYHQDGFSRDRRNTRARIWSSIGSGLTGLDRPTLGDQAAVPDQQGGRGDESMVTQRAGSSRVTANRIAHLARPGETWSPDGAGPRQRHASHDLHGINHLPPACHPV